MVVLLLACIFAIVKATLYIYDTRYNKPAEVSPSSTASTANLDQDAELDKPKAKSRVNSLDTFRGLAIVTMIFANCGAGRYWWLEHASWNGIHPADFIFPSFLWIMGVCIPISIKSQVARNATKQAMILKICQVSTADLLINTDLNENVYCSVR